MDNILKILEGIFRTGGKAIKIAIYLFLLVLAVIVIRIIFAAGSSSDEGENKDQIRQEIQAQIDSGSAKPATATVAVTAAENSVPKVFVEVQDVTELNSRQMVPGGANFKMAMHNKTGKTIAAIQGEMAIYDIFGEKIETIYIEVKKDIADGESRDISSVEGGSFTSRFSEIPENGMKKYKFEFSPVAVVYADGTKWDK